MAVTLRQKAAMVAIVLAGLVAGTAVLVTDTTNPFRTDEHGDDEETAHGESTEHAHDADGEDKHAHGDEHRDEDKGRNEPDKHEDQVRLSGEQAEAAGVTVESAGPAHVRISAEFPGEIRFNEDRTAHVVPRVAGVVENVPTNLGQDVGKGEVLAVIASAALSEHRSELLAAEQRLRLAKATYEREKQLWEDRISAQQDYQQASTALQEAKIAVRNARQKLAALGDSGASSELNRFELRAPFAGTVVEKHITLGEAVSADVNVFTLSDLSTVWAEFVVSAQDLVKVRVGEKATVSSTAFTGTAEGKVSYVGALLGEQTRTAKARVTLDNPGLAWRPGLFVTVSVEVEEEQVPVAVNGDAVQTMDNRDVVFVEIPGGFVARPVTLGRSDGSRIEVLQGLNSGARYAADNSFVLKSELGKGSAEHTH